jgi:hypothetical protein
MAQLRILLVIALVWLAAPSALAHHPFADEFDRSQTVTLAGTLTRLDWQNPHVYAYVDVKDTQGKVVNWKVEMGSPNALMKEGWTKTAVKPGDEVTIQAWKAKNNLTLANAESFTLPGGRKMTAASSIMMSETQLAQADSQQPVDQPSVGTTGAQTDPAATPAESLPSTASPLALYGLLGALALGGGMGLRRMRR